MAAGCRLNRTRESNTKTAVWSDYRRSVGIVHNTFPRLPRPKDAGGTGLREQSPTTDQKPRACGWFCRDWMQRTTRQIVEVLLTTEKKMNLFDILGASQQETCYANLLANAFRESEEFRRACIGVLLPGCDNTKGWGCFPELQVKLSSTGKTRRPDLLLANPSIESVILVEVKVQASENAGQSTDYASPECRSAVLERVQMQCEKPFRYVWLTPEGWSPVCTAFAPLRFLALKEALSDIRNGDRNLRRLIRELLQFIDEQEHMKPPLRDQGLADYLRPSHLTSWQRKFEGLCRSLDIPSERQCASEAPRGQYQFRCPYYLWLLKEADYTLNFALETPQRQSDPLVFSLQYHCGIGRKLKDMPADYQRTYSDKRRQFAAALRCCYATEQSGWRLCKADAEYAVAKVELKLDQSYSDFANQIQRLSGGMLKVVRQVGPEV